MEEGVGEERVGVNGMAERGRKRVKETRESERREMKNGSNT